MFNPNSAIDNPFSYAYCPNDRGMFNAWWMYEVIEFKSKVSLLAIGDAVKIANTRWYVSGFNNEDDIILVNDTVSPTESMVLQNDDSPVTCAEERSNIYRHGKRLGYQGPEEVNLA